MATTDLDLVNRAIGRVGGEPIEALNDDTPLSEFATREWPAKKAYLLGGYRWVFANRIAQLQQVAVLPEGCPRPYAFTRPADLGGAIHASRSAADERTAFHVPLVQTADYIAADCQTVWVEYTGGSDPNTWPPWFAELAVVAFGADVALQTLRRTLAMDLKVEAYGPPEMMGKGGLMLGAMQADSENAPERSLCYVGGGPLAEARWGIGVGVGPGGGQLGFPNNGLPFVIEVVGP